MFARAFGVILLAYLVFAYINQSFAPDLESRWLDYRYWLFRMKGERPITELELAQKTGNSSGEIWLAINGSVYDVSCKPYTYGPLGSYHFFAGKDAARAYGTGCFKSHLTHDLRGLSHAELEQIRGWERFFAKNERYWRVGELIHGSLPDHPPPHCKDPIPGRSHP